jgi:hypothetical protein
MKFKHILSSLAVLSFLACSTTGPGSDVSSSTIPDLMDAGPRVGNPNPIMDASGMDVAAQCSPESDKAFCTTFSRQCDNYAGLDNCSLPRVLNCGTCDTSATCINGGCVPTPIPIPGCAPESDANFCSQYSKNCGPIKNIDNCGMVRTVLSCGACTAPSSCTNNNVCLAPPPPNCVPETNRAFCARNALNCGSLTTKDNCGATRTVASCGSLAFSGGDGAVISGGVPVEISSINGAKHFQAWINPTFLTGPTYPNANILSIGTSDFKGGHSFPFGVNSNGLQIAWATPNILVKTNAWTFVFAGYTGSRYYVGKIVNDGSNLITRQDFDIPGDYGYFIKSFLQSGEVSKIGQSFYGQMNNVSIWSRERSNVEMLTNYHDCLAAPQVGLIRQWCMREGSGSPVITDAVTGVASVLNTASWDTGNCQ